MGAVGAHRGCHAALWLERPGPKVVTVPSYIFFFILINDIPGMRRKQSIM